MYNFTKGDIDQEEYPKTPNNLFIPDLVNFIVHIILKCGMTHFNIFTISPSYSMHT